MGGMNLDCVEASPSGTARGGAEGLYDGRDLSRRHRLPDQPLAGVEGRWAERLKPCEGWLGKASRMGKLQRDASADRVHRGHHVAETGQQLVR